MASLHKGRQTKRGGGKDVCSIQLYVMEAMLEEARRTPEIECCGLLAGRNHIISAIFPAQNALGVASAYEIAPEELFALFRRMRAERLDHLGIYHSHPSGENKPSPHDLAEAYYPDAAYFIISPRSDASQPVRAFRIRDGAAHELSISII